MKTSNIYIVTHHPCIDGFTAAYAGWLFFREKAIYLKETHKFKTTAKLLEEATKEDIIIYIDICPHREELEQLHSKVKELLVLDHHKTTQERCGDLPYVHIDMNESGATLAWKYFFPHQKLPFLFEIIRDNDLWRREIENTEMYSLWLSMQRKTFYRWAEIQALLEVSKHREAILKQAKLLRSYEVALLKRFISRDKLHWIYFKQLNIKMPAVNTALFQSEIGSIISERKKLGAAMYYRYRNGYRFSLRSTDDGPDVSKIASHYGGGGHRNAARFVLPSLEALESSCIFSPMEQEDYLSLLEEEELDETPYYE